MSDSKIIFKELMLDLKGQEVLVDKQLLSFIDVETIKAYRREFNKLVRNFRLKLIAIHFPVITLLLYLAFLPNQVKFIYFLSTFLIGILIWSFYELNLKTKTLITQKYFPQVLEAEEALRFLIIKDKLEK